MPHAHPLSPFAKVVSFVQLILLAAIFGFFYAYACSVMWGLDLVSAQVAIEAMNGINTAVTNGVFAPAFFGPLPMGVIAVVLLWITNNRKPALWFAAALLVYLFGAFMITGGFAVPLNRAMLAADIPTDPATAVNVWQQYSDEWQFWNWTRTGFSGLACLLTAIGIYTLGKAAAPK